MCAELCADVTQAQLKGGGVAISGHSLQGAIPTLKDEPSPVRPQELGFKFLDRQLAHRDHALEADPSFSGMPASFVEETWVNWLPKGVANPFYRDQLSAHVAELERQISNLNREIERQSGGLLDQRDAAVDLRQRPKRLLETS